MPRRSTGERMAHLRVVYFVSSVQKVFALSGCLAPASPAMASMALELGRTGKKERGSEARRICLFHAHLLWPIRLTRRGHASNGLAMRT